MRIENMFLCASIDIQPRGLHSAKHIFGSRTIGHDGPYPLDFPFIVFLAFEHENEPAPHSVHATITDPDGNDAIDPIEFPCDHRAPDPQTEVALQITLAVRQPGPHKIRVALYGVTILQCTLTFVTR